MKKAQAKAGAGVPSPNRITLLRDADGDGKAEVHSVFLKDLNSPFGMALVRNTSTSRTPDAVMRFEYRDGAREHQRARHESRRPCRRPDQPSLDQESASRAPTASTCTSPVGSNSNVAENGMENEERRAGDPGDRYRDRALARVRLRSAQSERHRLGNRRAARSGLPSTSATSSVTISCPTILLR
jgi:glucose/arabinose dehydrogenase